MECDNDYEYMARFLEGFATDEETLDVIDRLGESQRCRHVMNIAAGGLKRMKP